ncbi:MAG TPA: adenylate/guanylate cyclase domain-containing protein [Burkholderiales bacterium]|nr:adenylate/guanylate cyclase domain-containing protein [Burkholderiales bacterium]
MGRPRWYAQYLGQGLCRVKWLSAAGILLWIAQALALTYGDMQGLYRSAADVLGTSFKGLIYGCVGIGIAGAATVLLSGRGGVGIVPARRLVLMVALTTTVAEALLFGFAGMAPERVASLDLTLLITFAIMPLGLMAATTVLATVVAVILAAAWMVGTPLRPQTVLFLVHPLSFVVLGIVASRWYVGAFKAEQLGRLRLQRHMRQVERQKHLIEAQKDEALKQRAEIARQRSVLFQALSSALTTPVAHAYVDHGGFPTQLKTVCVIACDAVGFSDTCRKLQPERVVFELENFFREFDGACLKYQIEPLRAQGDSRIAIAGLWPGTNRHLQQEAISAVLAMLYFRRALPGNEDKADGATRGRVLWQARIGICLGPASCGVIDTGATESPGGSSGRLWFDVWGDTVNLAARIQEAAQPNQLLVRESVLWETCGLFEHGPIRQFHVKSTTLADVAEITGIRDGFRDEQGMPNSAFWDVFNDRSARPVRPNPQGTLAGGGSGQDSAMQAAQPSPAVAAGGIS